MLAVLHNIKAKDSKGNIVNLFDIFKVDKDDTGNGTLKIEEGYTFYIDDKNPSGFKYRINGKPINEKTIKSAGCWILGIPDIKIVVSVFKRLAERFNPVFPIFRKKKWNFK